MTGQDKTTIEFRQRMEDRAYYLPLARELVEKAYAARNATSTLASKIRLLAPKIPLVESLKADALYLDKRPTGGSLRKAFAFEADPDSAELIAKASRAKELLLDYPGSQLKKECENVQREISAASCLRITQIYIKDAGFRDLDRGLKKVGIPSGEHGLKLLVQGDIADRAVINEFSPVREPELNMSL